ncbi:MAG: cobyrinate a,c-diamide synthase [Alphaproteobacteria bacterium]|jgi:cobyrinic acid a,c-diamide synthase|nr:cobyrinate a,c-diamide synthase [Alphaproteobacteria bacterium]MBT4082173.1 cobyrinate a,c-diamide synthase [Alphaproteobacteria bacterium]MBT4545036.1 cobyrinate a,c-diamide synthase [Alphaproteobacteria bacterium]MBT7745819.1 cobyrinate a,c-diamide synthase [Alphaproteobacteria bacterium]
MSVTAQEASTDRRASCPAMMVAAPASNQGKTTVTAALARYHRNQGRRVRVFKTGPDFIDPTILEKASGAGVEQLDLWMVGEETCQTLLADAASQSDLILVEGVMGLYDGSPSSADLAKKFGLPVLLTVDASGMAQSFGAIVHGFTTYDPELAFAGVMANKVGSPGHADMLSETLTDGVPYLGHMLRDNEAVLPDRHLGLFQAAEISDLDVRLDRLAEQIEGTRLAELPQEIEFVSGEPNVVDQHLEGMTIACANDAAFSFAYAANIRCLKAMGAEVKFFSPLNDITLPECDAIWLPGGYPELHLDQLAQNLAMKIAMKAAHEAGTPILAECGGLLYLLDILEGVDGKKAEMAGLLPGHGKLNSKLSAIGAQSLAMSSGVLRGHTFHYSSLETPLESVARATSVRLNKPGEAIYSVGNLVASYVHFYFPSCPAAIADIFKSGKNNGVLG